MEVGRLGQRFNEFKTATMMKGRNSAARCDDLYALEEAGKLDSLLAGTKDS